MSTIIRGEGLHKSYEGGDRPTMALDGLDLAVQAGEFVAVMGPSASGKSTLLNILAGLDRPTGGEVYLGDRRIDTLSEAERAIIRRREVGFVFQLFNLIPSMTLFENIELPALIAGMGAGPARTRVDELLEQLELAGKARSSPLQLSGGEQQRAAIARALVNRPSVLFADEPTGNLDTDSAREVMRFLKSYNDAGQTIVLVTHDPRVAAGSDRIAHLRDGRIRDETRLGTAADPADVLTHMVDLEF